MTKSYPDAFIEYLVHFHGDRDYFECHEVLEEYWKTHTPMARDSIWVGWIQLAVALYHHRRNNMNGGLRTLDKAIMKFRLHEDEIVSFGIEATTFLERLQSLRASMASHTPYISIQLPIHDRELEKHCLSLCEERGFLWGDISDLKNPMIVERHSQRDRTEVIHERLSELAKRHIHKNH
ncbi:DUF309 domain-containing protein [Jeotgalibacillus soli]|uniref:DUF309 domain-containing protein n=1 Tax=Jeotgalibacillus soli TaxID=889306 RepID=A0A0C2VJS3_9BACL|nr:DUF309 domain-containing protein [Jeotgalibacillus soli]KIL44248.1 hypothetical protein KP78_32120 [Jeotgalibacillus soli]